MGFASAYLEKKALFPQLIGERPVSGTEIIVTVPSFDEPRITDLLDALSLCDRPACEAEVIIVVNAPRDSSAESIENNKNSLASIELWKRKNRYCFFSVHPVDVTSSPTENWGVGSARKTGMDEALRRFDHLDNPEGVIMNLDADCRVAANYFTAIHSQFCTQRKRKACSVYFEHPVCGTEFPAVIYRSIVIYELHLRYYYQGLRLAGYPDVFHTVGSAMGVKALPYAKAGGMNRRQAGEDFYFIQKLLPMGGYFTLNETAVYPSPRPSSRVPFGTGTVMERLTVSNDNVGLLTYNIKAFEELKCFFGMTEIIFDCCPDGAAGLYKRLPDGIRNFVDENEWIGKISEIKNNTAGFPAFKKRFFEWFNMFRIVRYMNSVHPNLFPKRPVADSALELLGLSGYSLNTTEPEEILRFYRDLERPGYAQDL